MLHTLADTERSYHLWQAVFAGLCLMTIAGILGAGLYKGKIINSNWKFLLEKDSPYLCFLVAAWLLLLVFAGMVLCMSVAEYHAQEWLEPESSSLGKFPETSFPLSCTNCLSLYKRIEYQFLETNKGAKMHLAVTIYYYSRYFMAITMAAITGIIAGIFLVFVTNTGWGATSWLVRTVFILLSVCAAFFTSMPSLFEQEDNIDKNKDLYVAYNGLHNNILSFRANCDSIRCDSVTRYVKTVDNKLLELSKFPLKFNRSAVDFSKTIQSISTTTNP